MIDTINRVISGKHKYTNVIRLGIGVGVLLLIWTVFSSKISAMFSGVGTFFTGLKDKLLNNYAPSGQTVAEQNRGASLKNSSDYQGDLTSMANDIATKLNINKNQNFFTRHAWNYTSDSDQQSIVDSINGLTTNQVTALADLWSTVVDSPASGKLRADLQSYLNAKFYAKLNNAWAGTGL